MTTIVTGGAGFIGSHVVEALLARGERVVVIDDFNDYYDPALKRRNLEKARTKYPSQLEIIESDVANLTKEAWSVFLDSNQEKKVIHLAARAGVRNSFLSPALYHHVNVRGTQVILDYAKQGGIKHIVLASSSSVYGERSGDAPFKEDDELGEAKSPYARSKQEMEIWAKRFQEDNPHMSVTALRFFTVYGPRQRPDMAIAKFVHAIDSGEPIWQYGDGSARRDFTYIDDIVQGILGALDRPHADGWRVYNLGESRITTISEVIKLVEQALGKAAIIHVEPPQQGDVTTTYADISRAKAELGYDPKTLPEEGIKKYVEWYRTTGLSPAK